jgi:hypothetical protein
VGVVGIGPRMSKICGMEVGAANLASLPQSIVVACNRHSIPSALPPKPSLSIAIVIMLSGLICGDCFDCSPTQKPKKRKKAKLTRDSNIKKKKKKKFVTRERKKIF